MLFSRAAVAKTQAVKADMLDKTNFVSALAIFSLAHSDLMAFSVSLKVQEVAQKAADLAATSQEMSATAEETSASTQQISASMQQIKAGERPFWPLTSRTNGSTRPLRRFQRSAAW